MIKDLFVSFRENLKEKTTNPYLGTFIIVWIVHNWNIVYSFFHFDEEMKLIDRLDYMKTFFEPRGFVLNMLTCVWVTFLVLIGTYIVLVISRFIINIFDKRTIPWVYKVTVSNSIVLKSEFDKMEDEKNRFQKKYEEEKIKRIQAETEIERLEKSIINAENKPKKNEKMHENTKQIYQAIKDREELKDLGELIDNVNQNRLINNNSEFIKFAIRVEIIKFRNSYSDDLAYYEFTAIGTIIKEYYVQDVDL